MCRNVVGNTQKRRKDRKKQRKSALDRKPSSVEDKRRSDLNVSALRRLRKSVCESRWKKSSLGERQKRQKRRNGFAKKRRRRSCTERQKKKSSDCRKKPKNCNA